jgi:hypothetical protein
MILSREPTTEEACTFKKKHGLCFPTTVRDAGSDRKMPAAPKSGNRGHLIEDQVQRQEETKTSSKPRALPRCLTAPNTNFPHLLWTQPSGSPGLPARPVFCMIIMSRTSKQPIPLRAISCSSSTLCPVGNEKKVDELA